MPHPGILVSPPSRVLIIKILSNFPVSWRQDVSLVLSTLSNNWPFPLPPQLVLVIETSLNPHLLVTESSFLTVAMTHRRVQLWLPLSFPDTQPWTPDLFGMTC